MVHVIKRSEYMGQKAVKHKYIFDYVIFYSIFLGCCYPNVLEMQRLCNEDLCMIIIDRALKKIGGCFDQCVRLPQLHYMTINCLGIQKICKHQFI